MRQCSPGERKDLEAWLFFKADILGVIHLWDTDFLILLCRVDPNFLYPKYVICVGKM